MKRAPIVLRLFTLLLAANLFQVRAADDSKNDKVESSPPVLKVLSEGQTPRTKLRHTPKAGLERKLELSTKMGMQMSLGQQQMPAMKLPTIKMKVDFKVAEVSGDGDIRYEFEFLKPDVVNDSGADPIMAGQIAASMEGMKGAKGSTTCTSRGIVKEFKMDLPADIPPQQRQILDEMKQTVENMTSLLPEEAVGSGAKWQVEQLLKARGMNMKQTTLYELLSVNGTSTKMRVSINQSAAAQKMSMPEMPGMTVDLVSFNGDGRGQMNLDLAELLPSMASITSTANMQMKMPGQAEAMVMKMDMTMGMSSR